VAFPEPVKDPIGTALSVAQFGGKHPAAKPWKRQGPGVLEVEDYDHATYRAVNRVRFQDAVYGMSSWSGSGSGWHGEIMRHEMGRQKSEAQGAVTPSSGNVWGSGRCLATMRRPVSPSGWILNTPNPPIPAASEFRDWRRDATNR